VLEHCNLTRAELERQVPHILSSLPVSMGLPERFGACNGVEMGPPVKLYDTAELRSGLRSSGLEACRCMRNHPDAMRRFQAVVPLPGTKEMVNRDPVGATETHSGH